MSVFKVFSARCGGQGVVILTGQYHYTIRGDRVLIRGVVREGYVMLLYVQIFLKVTIVCAIGRDDLRCSVDLGFYHAGDHYYIYTRRQITYSTARCCCSTLLGIGGYFISSMQFYGLVRDSDYLCAGVGSGLFRYVAGARYVSYYYGRARVINSYSIRFT